MALRLLKFSIFCTCLSPNLKCSCVCICTKINYHIVQQQQSHLSHEYLNWFLALSLDVPQSKRNDLVFFPSGIFCWKRHRKVKSNFIRWAPIVCVQTSFEVYLHATHKHTTPHKWKHSKWWISTKKSHHLRNFSDTWLYLIVYK